MLLTKLEFSEYGAKDGCRGADERASGTQELILSNSKEQLLEYIEKRYFFGEEENKVVETAELKDFLDQHPEKKEEAQRLGLTIEEEWVDEPHFGRQRVVTVSGPKQLINRLAEGSMWQEVGDEEAYYGIDSTLYDWEDQQEVSEEEAEVLVRLKLVHDIRNS